MKETQEILIQMGFKNLNNNIWASDFFGVFILLDDATPKDLAEFIYNRGVNAKKSTENNNPFDIFTKTVGRDINNPFDIHSRIADVDIQIIIETSKYHPYMDYGEVDINLYNDLTNSMNIRY